jgi:hypothetical protein
VTPYARNKRTKSVLLPFFLIKILAPTKINNIDKNTKKLSRNALSNFNESSTKKYKAYPDVIDKTDKNQTKTPLISRFNLQKIKKNKELNTLTIQAETDNTSI